MSLPETKTLKQLLQEAEEQFDLEYPDEDTPYMTITLGAVKKWLTQKLKMQPTSNSVEHSNERQRIKTVRKLVEDVER